MKKTLFLTSAIMIFQICLFTNYSLKAQSDSTSQADTTLKFKWTKIKLNTMDKKEFTGYLYSVDEDSIHILTKKLENGSVLSLQNCPRSLLVSMPAHNVNEIRIQNRWHAPVYGAAIGLVVGGIIGFVSYHKHDESFDPLASGSAVDNATGGALGGMIIGGSIGTFIYLVSKKVFKIHGDPLRYTKSREKLFSYQVVYGDY